VGSTEILRCDQDDGRFATVIDSPIQIVKQRWLTIRVCSCHLYFVEFDSLLSRLSRGDGPGHHFEGLLQSRLIRFPTLPTGLLMIPGLVDGPARSLLLAELPPSASLANSSARRRARSLRSPPGLPAVAKRFGVSNKPCAWIGLFPRTALHSARTLRRSWPRARRPPPSNVDLHGTPLWFSVTLTPGSSDTLSLVSPRTSRPSWRRI